MEEEEEKFRIKYTTLKEYFDSRNIRVKRDLNSKVARLPTPQFIDVSNDLHEELQRRLYNPELPFLQIRNDLLPKRNQARQKMATLNQERFNELSAELMFEIEKRFPFVLQSVSLMHINTRDMN